MHPLSKPSLIIVCQVAFVLGIFLGKAIDDPSLNIEYAAFILLSASLSGLLFIWRQVRIRQIILILFFMSLGVWRWQLVSVPNNPDLLARYIGQKIVWQGRVLETKVDRGFRKYVMEPERIIKPAQQDVSEQRILLSARLYPEYAVGDRLEISGKLYEPSNIGEFDYVGYLQKQGIGLVGYYPNLRHLASDQDNILSRQVRSFRSAVGRIVMAHLPESEASLASGLLLGQTDFDDQLKEAFSRTGLTHIVAISGMNITLISFVFIEALIFAGLWRKQAFWATTAFLIFYILAVGAPASAIRAGIMGIAYLFALSYGRLSSPIHLVAFAAFVMTMINPLILFHDLGFQLSFLAVIALIYILPRLDEFIGPYLKWAGVFGQILVATLSIQIISWPLTAWYFGSVSLISPIANSAVVWLITPLTIVLALSVILSMMLPWFGGLIFFLPWLALRYVIIAAEAFSRWPVSNWSVDYISPIFITGYYIFLAMWIIRSQRLKKADSLI